MGVNGDRSGKGFLALLIAIIIILLAIIGYKIFFINIEVDGSSMEPTLHNGNELVINKLALPDYDEIIVVNIEEQAKSQNKNHYWIIKRVIGKEGDIIELRDGAVYRKKPSDSDFVLVENNGYETLGATNPQDNNISTWTVKEGEYFFLGDNRENSLDSRHYGVRSKKDLVGVVTNWSFEKKGFWYSFNKIVNYPSKWFSSCKNNLGE